MNDRQERFAREYVVDHNGAQAAARAGYSAKRAKQTARELLRRPDVAQLVAELDGEKAKELGIEATDLVRWSLEVLDLAKRGNPRTYKDSVVRDEDGEVIRVPDLAAAMKAIETVARLSGALVERSQVEHSGDVVYTLRLERDLEQEQLDDGD